METDKAMEQLRHMSNGLRKPQNSSGNALRETMRRRYGDREQFILTFTSSHEAGYCRHVERCIFGSAPTLSQVNTAYGANTSAAWLIPLLTDVSEFCGCKEKITPKQIDQLADIITLDYGYLKVTEVMLFFWWFKGGRYGKFYGSVDPMVITTTLHNFIKDRNVLIARKESEDEERRQAEWKKNAITYEQWRARHEEV